MQHSRSYRFTALTLALVIALSSMGMSVNVHYCQGNLSGISILPKKETSGCHAIPKNPKKKSCCKSKLSEDKPCCSDKTSIVSLDYDGPSGELPVLEDLDFIKVVVSPQPVKHVLRSSLVSATGLDPPDKVFPSGQTIRISFSSFLC